MKHKKLTGTKMPQFTYDTPYQAENDFYALCAGETPLLLVFLPNFGHPISRVYLSEYLKGLSQLTAGRLACVVRSHPQRIAEQLGGAVFPIPLICDAEGVLYDYFEVQQTTSVFDWTFAARRIIKAAKKEGYHHDKKTPQLLPLTMVFAAQGEILYAHRGCSLTDLPEDCDAINAVCQRLQGRFAHYQEVYATRAAQQAETERVQHETATQLTAAVAAMAADERAKQQAETETAKTPVASAAVS